jgi:hypothetical protein
MLLRQYDAVLKTAVEAILLAAFSLLVKSLVHYHQSRDQARVQDLWRISHRLVIFSNSRINCTVSVAPNAFLAGIETVRWTAWL